MKTLNWSLNFQHSVHAHLLKVFDFCEIFFCITFSLSFSFPFISFHSHSYRPNPNLGHLLLETGLFCFFFGCDDAFPKHRWKYKRVLKKLIVWNSSLKMHPAVIVVAFTVTKIDELERPNLVQRWTPTTPSGTVDRYIKRINYDRWWVGIKAFFWIYNLKCVPGESIFGPFTLMRQVGSFW